MNRLLAFAALSAALTVGSLSAATLPIGSWDTFSFGSAPSPITFPTDGYQLSLPSSGLLRVVDCCVIGDRFDVYIDSVFAFSTTAVAPGDDGVDAGLFDGDSAWADSRVSKGSILLGPGSYQIDINVVSNAVGFSSGGGFIRADVSDVPEPASVALCGAGLVGLVFLRRRK